jgi:serine/threonine-protein kinase RsbW/stage II sporulation protein AB (anti-sigma F factor)
MSRELLDRRTVDRADAPYVSWPATPESIADARSEIAARGREAGAGGELLDDIKLAVSEACSNAVMHAYVTPQRRAERFAIATAARGGRFEVWVADEGRGAEPAEPTLGGGGLGLGLMAALSPAMTVGRLRDGGTQVHLRFTLPAA